VTTALCDDHSRGNTPRYTGRNAPRTNCPDCQAIYAGSTFVSSSPETAGQYANVRELRHFSRLDDAGKQRLLLGGSGFSVVGFDIEATHLKPNVGRILCCSFKPLGGEVYTFSGLDRRFKRPDVFDDGALAIAIRDELEKYDIIVGWNSKNFDVKFINSRALHAMSRTKRAQYHVDGMWAWRSKSQAWSGLKNVQKFALPENEHEKTEISWAKWMQALGWDRLRRNEAMQEIIEHCELDVIVLEDVYRLMAQANVIRSLRKDGGIL
jgi:uncharacterized protein YprB with RNaseH-like and TPR domain